jgi:hypothetical protein
LTTAEFALRPNIVAYGFGNADEPVMRAVGTVGAFIAERDVDVRSALKSIMESLVHSIVDSASQGQLAIPNQVPGMRTIAVDPVI